MESPLKSQVLQAIADQFPAWAPKVLSVEPELHQTLLTLNTESLSAQERMDMHTRLSTLLARRFPNHPIRLKLQGSGASPLSPPNPHPSQTPKSHPSPSPSHSSSSAAAPGAIPSPKPIPHVKHIVAVASGKGGVGKSTVSAMLALGFRELGVKTALIDADIYGPSQATIFGVHEKPKGSANGEKILPVVAHGISLMSFSFFIDPHQPAVWRGPVVMKVLEQFFFDVAWPESDVLLIDLPPGTGDIQLSMIQYVPLAGALMVTTPQHLSVLDAIKGGNMFHKLNVPVLGVVENMSKFVCPDCGGHHALFRHGGGEAAADQLSCPLLVRFPLNPTLCDYLDIGRVDLAFQLPAVKDLALELATQVLAKLPSAT